jgi:hypothetical protein
MSAFKLLFAAPVLLSATPVAPTMNSGLPPERFRANSAAFIIFTDRAGIEAACGKAQPGYVIIACKREIDGTPVIIMPNACPMGQTEIYARILCHESGHVQGWSGAHEE